ncbi:MAG: AAA family ATPase [Clostridia bacterium]|nr:AAA family ATPase [Clostridia bacterium]
MSEAIIHYKSSIVQVLTFYGMQTMPFGKDIHTSEVFQALALKDAQAMLEMGLETEDILLLTGPVGCGKSVTVRHFMASLDNNRYIPIYIQGQIKSVTELYKMILKGLLIEPPFSPTKAKILYIKSIMEMKKKPVIIIDDAQDMADQSLLAIKSLVNFAQDSSNKVTILLSGQPELKDKLTYSMFAAIRQRIKLDISLNPMSLEETCRFIDHFLAICGRQVSVFSDNAKSEIFRMASGIPRVVCRICFKALIQGTIKKRDVIDSGDIPFDSF